MNKVRILCRNLDENRKIISALREFQSIPTGIVISKPFVLQKYCDPKGHRHVKLYSSNVKDTELRKPNTPRGKFDKDVKPSETKKNEETEVDPYAPFPDNVNPESGEIGGPRGPEPTRYGDWERKGRVTDF
ncbi:C6orf57 (predicted) [Pycnogonum litorale]